MVAKLEAAATGSGASGVCQKEAVVREGVEAGPAAATKATVVAATATATATAAPQVTAVGDSAEA
jgi:hypothetical protein